MQPALLLLGLWVGMLAVRLTGLDMYPGITVVIPVIK